VSRQVQDLLDQDLIEPAHSEWSFPVVLVRKKDGSWRFCVDYCKLNSVTIQDAYPLPRIDESMDALAGSKYFSTLNLLSRYWQVPLSLDAQDKAAFNTGDGLWKWKVLLIGLMSASNFPTAHGAGPQWATLEDPPHLSRRHHCFLPRFYGSCQLSAGGL